MDGISALIRRGGSKPLSLPREVGGGVSQSKKAVAHKPGKVLSH